MNKDLIYIGVVSSYSDKNQFLVLKDIPPDFPNIDTEIDIFLGFSTNFLEKIKILKIENRKSNIHIFLTSNIKAKFEELLRMGVYVERDIVEAYKPNFFGPEDILDCLVYDQNDNLIGRVVDVHILPSQFVIYADSDTYTIPLPFIKEIVIEFDLKRKIIKMDLPENYLDIAELKE